MGATDAMLDRLTAEIEEKKILQDSLVETAQREGRDLKPEEAELYQRASDRMAAIESQLTPLREGMRIAADSARRTQEISDTIGVARSTTIPKSVEYRSAGSYIVDHWQSALGAPEARERLGLYLRAAAHQTTADNLGVIPEPIVGSVLNFIDSARPIVSALGPLPVPGGRFTRPKVTQHTDVGAQSAEKGELVSQKMLITRVQVLMATYGGYVNVSRQDIDWSVPQILDLVINDLAAQYAIETELATATALDTAATAGPTIATGTPTPEAVATAIWTAAALSFTATKGAGSVFLAVPPGMLGMLGPLFSRTNPTNAIGSGFNASNFNTGSVGVISGIPVVMSTAVAANKLLLVNTVAAEVYEQRIGSLQVTEPSVLGIQVAYAGYFAPIVVEAGGVIEITKTP